MAEVTKPIALDESFNTTESTPRNIADVLAEGLASANTLANLNDVTINTGTLADKQSLTYNALTGTWVNSTLATPNELNDLSDVTINTPLNKQELLYNDALEVFQNKTTRVELTTAEYNNLVEHDWVLPDVDYYITDAPSMQGTSADLSYDGTTKSTYTKIEELDSSKADASSLSTVATSGSYNDLLNKPTVETTTIKSTSSSETGLSIDLTSYDALLVTLKFYTNIVSSTLIMGCPSGTHRVSGSIDALNNFTCGSIIIDTNGKLTQIGMVVNYSNACSVTLQGIKFLKS